MTAIPLPQGIGGIDDFPKLKELVTNLIPSENGFIGAPSLELFAQSSAPSRGCATWAVTNKAYFVSGNRFLRVNEDTTIDDLGFIDGTNDVVFSQGQNNLVICVIGGQAYTYNDSSGLTRITDADYISSSSVDFIDGRHVFVPSDGSPPFFSEIDNPNSIGSLSFFDAEELPDLNKSLINLSNQLYVLGEGSIEVFRTSPSPDIVFTRREGARVDYGFIGGLARYKNSFAFLGRAREEAPSFYVMGSGNAIRISNNAIDEILEEMSEEERNSCKAFRFKWKGLEILVFDFLVLTLGFHEGKWFYLDSNIDGQVSPWRVRCICSAYGLYLVGDKENGNIGFFSNLGMHQYSRDIEWGLRTFIRSGRNSHFRVGLIELNGLTGRSDTEKSIGLSISKDGESFDNFHYRSLGDRGKYRKRVKWQPPGGIGKFEDFCGIEIKSTSDAIFGMEALTFE